MRKSLFLLIVVALVLGSMLPAVASAQEPKYTISLLASTLDNPYWIAVIDGAKKAVEQLDADVELVVLALDKEGQTASQIAQMEDRVANEDDAILIGPQDTKALIPAIEMANEAGIPVIAVDKAAEGGKFESVIMTDNIVAGGIGARFVAEKIGGKGKVLVLEGVPGGQTAEDRKRGAHLVLEEYPDIEIISLPADWETAKGQSVTEDVLTANSDLAGVVAMNDMMAMGAYGALKAAGLEDVPIVGCDAIPAALEMIMNDQIDGTVAQFPGRMGFLGVEYAIRVINGESVPEYVDSGTMLITKDNVNAKAAGMYGW